MEVDVASEFRYRDPYFGGRNPGSRHQSVRRDGGHSGSAQGIQREGRGVLGIVNVVGSSIAREADNVMYTLGGPEIAVATTKAYSAQLIALYLLAMKFAHVRGTLDDRGLREMIEDLKALPAQVEMLLNNKQKIQRFANRYLAAKDVFLLEEALTMPFPWKGL